MKSSDGVLMWAQCRYGILTTVNPDLRVPEQFDDQIGFTSKSQALNSKYLSDPKIKSLNLAAIRVASGWLLSSSTVNLVFVTQLATFSRSAGKIMLTRVAHKIFHADDCKPRRRLQNKIQNSGMQFIGKGFRCPSPMSDLGREAIVINQAFDNFSLLSLHVPNGWYVLLPV